MAGALRNPRFIFSAIFSLLINAVIWAALYWYIPQPDPEVTYGFVLHYNIYFGVDLIGEWYKIFYIPLSGLLVLVFNMVLGIIIYKKEPFLSSVLELSTVGIHLILLVAAVTTIISNQS